MLWYVLNGGGGNISRVLIIESNEGSHSIIDEIIMLLPFCTDLKLLWLPVIELTDIMA